MNWKKTIRFFRCHHCARCGEVVPIALLVGLTCNAPPASGISDHRVEMKIDQSVDILPAGSPPGMMKMVRAPDGSIYLNTQSSVARRALLESTDGGNTWSPFLVKFSDPRVWPSQTLAAFTVASDGQLWAVHQPGMIDHGGIAREVKKPWPKGKLKPLWASCSSDGGRTWQSTRIDVGQLVPPGYGKAPFVKTTSGYACFIERPDGTMMFAANMFYQFTKFAPFLNPDPARRGIPYVMIRTKDGGKTWADPTFVRRWGATETDFAVDPKDPDHILAISRKQRGLVPGEDKETAYRQARAPLSWPYPFKGSQLLESTDGGRTFQEVANAYTGLYGHRGTICWTDRDVVIASYMFNPDLPQGARATGPPKVLHTAAGVSLDGGKTWVDGTKAGTTCFEKARRFVLSPRGGTQPTIEVAPNRYLTAYADEGGSVKGLVWHLVDAPGKMLSLTQVKPRPDAPAADKARGSAMPRQRRVIFNNDGDDLADTPAPATKEGFLSRRMAHVADTGVDSVFYRDIGPTPFYSNATKTARNAELNELGTDALKLAIETCRKHNIEIFWSCRMNDIHDAVSDAPISNWKKEHRHLLLVPPQDQGTYPQSDPRWFWTFVDYDHREVRDLNLTVIRNVLNEYDVDGIDLDFLRHPAYFKETLLFQPATREHLDMMTDMMGQIRKELLAAGKRKGKPVLLSVRILPTLALNNHFGFDVQRWLKEGTIDLITIGAGYDPFTVTVKGKEMIDLGHAHDTPVYVCLSRSGFWHAYADTIESWRAAAANAWQAGADGIMTFELFPDRFGPDAVKFARSVWSDISDPDTLVDKDKLYYIERPPQAAFNCRSVPVEGRLPVTARKGERIERVLPVGDDIPALKDRLERLRLRICLLGLQANDVVKTQINGNPIEMSPQEPPWLSAEVDPSVMKKGANILAVTYQAGNSESLTLTAVELAVQVRGPSQEQASRNQIETLATEVQ